MERIIIIDDSIIRKELNEFLNANRKHILLNSELGNSAGKSLIKEYIEKYNKQNKLKVRSEDTFYLLRLSEIICLCRKPEITVLELINGENLKLKENFDHYEKQLCDFPFFKPHDDFLVNLDHLKSISDDRLELILTRNIRVPLTGENKKVFIEKIEKLLGD